VKRSALLAALALFPVAQALAHPHVFISNRMTLVFNAEALQGILLTWTFDEMFSSMILADFKADRTGRFAPQDARALREAAFDNLKSYSYFVSLRLGTTPLGGLTAEQFTPSVADRSKLVYTFFLPLNVPVSRAEQVLRVTVYDDTYFTAFDPLRVADVAVRSPDSVAHSLSVGKTRVPEAWPGQYMPDQLEIRFNSR
jgi:ABC-type uncharacterized transport system substrate-binding protein